VARKFGVKSAMSTSVALRKCPELILLDVNMKKYKEVSKVLREIFLSYTHIVEPLSLDEAYLDVTDVQEHSNSATYIAKAIRDDILVKTGLTASAGIAPNKLLAKISSDINKPNGMYVVKPDEIDVFIEKLPVKKLFGVGKVTHEKLLAMDIKTCKDLQHISLETLITKFGKYGYSLYNYCRGIDNREVQYQRIRKSVGVENTYQQDLQALDEWFEKLDDLYAKFTARMSDEYTQKVVGVFVKITDSNFNKNSVSRQASSIDLASLKLLCEDLYNKQTLPIRLLGIGVRLGSVDKKQMVLF
jgi:DNA polymerase-4